MPLVGGAGSGWRRDDGRHTPYGWIYGYHSVKWFNAVLVCVEYDGDDVHNNTDARRVLMNRQLPYRWRFGKIQHLARKGHFCASVLGGRRWNAHRIITGSVFKWRIYYTSASTSASTTEPIESRKRHLVHIAIPSDGEMGDNVRFTIPAGHFHFKLPHDAIRGSVLSVKLRLPAHFVPGPDSGNVSQIRMRGDPVSAEHDREDAGVRARLEDVLVPVITRPVSSIAAATVAYESIPDIAAVPVGTPVPPRPFLPQKPGRVPQKPEGKLHPHLHPFTVVQQEKYRERNPDNPLLVLIKDRVNIHGASACQQTYTSIRMCCWLVTPLEEARSIENWIRRIASEYCWTVGPDASKPLHILFGKYPSLFREERCVFHKTVIDYAIREGIDIFGLYGAPAATVTETNVKDYDIRLANHAADVKAYDAAVAATNVWNARYGAAANGIIPGEPNAEDKEVCECMTDVGQEGAAKIARNQKLLEDAECIDCADPNCLCSKLATPLTPTPRGPQSVDS